MTYEQLLELDKNNVVIGLPYEIYSSFKNCEFNAENKEKYLNTECAICKCDFNEK